MLDRLLHIESLNSPSSFLVVFDMDFRNRGVHGMLSIVIFNATSINARKYYFLIILKPLTNL